MLLDGQSLEWASEFITYNIDKYVHFDVNLLSKHKDMCAKYSIALVENLAVKITDMAASHGY